MVGRGLNPTEMAYIAGDMLMQNLKKFHIGFRTLKTALAVIIAMMLVSTYGTTSSRLIFATLGAIAVMEPTLKDSIGSCLTQIFGMFFGALAGVLLMLLPINPLVATGMGIVLVITIYNLLHIRFSPALPCLMVVIICTTPDIQPLAYAMGRLWDTTIGLGVGLLINALIFPYNNTRKIRTSAEAIDREIIAFLEDMFDGDNEYPDTEKMTRNIDDLARQLSIFSNQWLLLRLKRNRRRLEVFNICADKARQLVAQMEVLSRMEKLGKLNEENLNRLVENGALIRDVTVTNGMSENDIITNYHVTQILNLREELIEALKKSKRNK